MKIFISGGCGQVGSHIAELCLERGDEVIAIDNFATGRRVHLPEKHERLRFIEGSIADKALIDSLFEETKPDAVVHTAASYKDPTDFYNDTLTNCVGGANLVRASLDQKVGRFIYFQTALCYGTKPLHNPITLEHPKFPANSSYAISKTTAEDYLEISGLDYVSFRLANVIGPRNVSGPLPIFFQRLSEGKKCFVTTARRDFVFVQDLARTVIKAIDGTGSRAYHFSSGTDVSIKELYDDVVAAMKLPEYPEPEIRALGPDDAASILLDPSRTYADFGKIEFTPLKETVRAGVEYFQKYGVHGGYTHLKLEEKKN
ncbi:MAG TPA: NAD-dependent epimerase/dehydratase family protein [Terrimicrobiaceae bacterium]|nr:NAD-dependent epimerase/dehydratase family protein [Terrimicrobiaceae bacterium]